MRTSDERREEIKAGFRAFVRTGDVTTYDEEVDDTVIDLDKISNFWLDIIDSGVSAALEGV